jgi:GH25 family lysozyme M1 (1,4-beta-N-acetylmuramidase)
MPLYGVDVSSFQGSPDYAKVKASGVTFVIAKATEGVGYTDPTYARNRAAIRDAGLIPGAYHFLRGTHDGPSQAEAFVRTADPHAIHALDVECLEDVHKLNRHLDVPGFLHRYRELLPGRTILIYTGRDFWTACAGTATPGTTYGPLWAAGAVPNAYVRAAGSLPTQWASTGGHPTSGLPWAGWTSWAICQFTDHAQVPGISGGVDGDAFTGTLDQLKALTGSQEDDMPTLDEIGSLIDAKLAAILGGNKTVGAATFASTFGKDADGTPRTAGELLVKASQQPAPADLAAALAPALTAAIKALPVGTATVDDATIAKVAQATATELATYAWSAERTACRKPRSNGGSSAPSSSPSAPAPAFMGAALILGGPGRFTVPPGSPPPASSPASVYTWGFLILIAGAATLLGAMLPGTAALQAGCLGMAFWYLWFDVSLTDHLRPGPPRRPHRRRRLLHPHRPRFRAVGRRPEHPRPPPREAVDANRDPPRPHPPGQARPADANPFEAYLLGVCALQGWSVLAGTSTPTSLSQAALTPTACGSCGPRSCSSAASCPSSASTGPGTPSRASRSSGSGSSPPAPRPRLRTRPRVRRPAGVRRRVPQPRVRGGLHHPRHPSHSPDQGGPAANRRRPRPGGLMPDTSSSTLHPAVRSSPSPPGQLPLPPSARSCPTARPAPRPRRRSPRPAAPRPRSWASATPRPRRRSTRRWRCCGRCGPTSPPSASNSPRTAPSSPPPARTCRRPSPRSPSCERWKSDHELRMTDHGVWDAEVVDQLRELGGDIRSAPPLGIPPVQPQPLRRRLPPLNPDYPNRPNPNA